MHVIGLTGGSGSGKSTAAGFIKEKGIPVLDADKIAREITEKGSPALSKLVSEFGEGILLADGNLDRRAMADRIFNDAHAREKLESIVTKGVLDTIAGRIEEERRTGRELLVLDAPTLFETGADAMCDEVWLVTAPKEIRLRRLAERDDVPLESLNARMASQMSDEEKAGLSDFVIENAGTEEELRDKIESLLNQKTLNI